MFKLQFARPILKQQKTMLIREHVLFIFVTI